MDASDIARYRLHNQQIAQQAFGHPGQVVAWLGAVQAQDYAGSLWSVGLRVPNATAAGIEQAIASKAIVRTWPMRGTLHFVATADVRWMLKLLTPRIVAGSVRRRQQLELDDVVFAHGAALLTSALQGGKQLPRDAVYRLLEEAGISTAGQRGIHILWRLAQDGLICFGARAGNQPTFALLDEWAPATKTLHRDEALAELARRYFTGHGPATMRDFMWWSGLPAAAARAGIEMVRSQLMQEIVSGQTYWFSQHTPASQPDTSAVYLLPGFDEYLLGYRDRSAVLDAVHSQTIQPGSNGMFSPTIIIDGRVAGTWKRTFRKGAVAVMPIPFTSFNEAQERAIAAAVERYARFLGMPITRS